MSKKIVKITYFQQFEALSITLQLYDLQHYTMDKRQLPKGKVERRTRVVYMIENIRHVYVIHISDSHSQIHSFYFQMVA